MNGFEMFLRALGRNTEEVNAVQSAMQNLKNAYESHATTRDTFNAPERSQQESFETKIKHEVWRNLVDHIECGKYTQAELAQKLQIHQPDVSDLLRGKFSRFSTDKLIRYADKLNLRVQFQIATAKNTPKERV